MTRYRAFEATELDDFRLVARELREPGQGEVRVRVAACGVCHSDALRFGHPTVPGHEIVGFVDAVGEGVSAWQLGDHVGLGLLGGHCGKCEQCRRGDFVMCADQPFTGAFAEGGYAEYVYARSSGLVRIPDGMTSVEAAPLLCAGLTVFTAFPLVKARPGARVAIQGIGGLGHLGLQYAARLGYEVIAIARGTDKQAEAVKLGAHHYIDSTAGDPAEALRELGGADAIIATAASGASMSALVKGLAPRGQLIVLGLSDDPVQVQTMDLALPMLTITGNNTGTAMDNEDNLRFAALHHVRPMIEVMPFERTPEAFAHMLSGKARFRVVLEMAQR